MGAAGGVGHLGVPEVEVVLQHEIVLLLKREHLVHRLEGGGGLAVGEEPFRAQEMAVEQESCTTDWV